MSNKPDSNQKQKSGMDILRNRRSIRHFKDDMPDENLLRKVLDSVTDAPTSRNKPSCYLVIVRDSKLIENLGDIRGRSTSPISKSPVAVAIVADTDITKRPEDDSIIASYHLMLAAKYYGLGTCYIADMNRDNVKKMLDIPQNHYIGTITPLGIPDENPNRPDKESIIKRSKFLD
ncbi:MAG: nitroreductase family protein [Candidatus Zixiibacteriota bacterium]